MEANDFGFERAVRIYESQCNDADAQPVEYCINCGRPLYVGDTAYRVCGDLFCECCCKKEWL